MIFTSFEFLSFFLLVLFGRSLCRSLTSNNWLLLIASYAFYISWSLPCGLLILVVSLVDYHVGRKLAQTELPGRRKRWLAVSIATNLSLLGFFKYTNFLLANAGWGLRLLGLDTSGWRFDIILPVGISFFTFKSMSYTLDVYRRSIQPCRSARDYLLFVSFFPQLLAGPIVRAADLLPQLVRPARATAAEVESGLLQFGLGALKKLVIADQVAGHVDLIFASPGQYDALTLLQGAFGYAVQIYCDFSGYSDMAIGAARIMGYSTPENFRMPYSAINITEFWHRWHITLSSWFRDYLFLPLAYASSRRLANERYGGIRVDVIIYVAAILATFLVCGLWHGASWTFVLWGGLHGIALAVHRAWKVWRPFGRLARNRPFRVGSALLARVATLAVVLAGWILFRAQTLGAAWDYMVRIATWESGGTRLLSPYILPACLAVLLVHLLVHKDRNWALELPQRPVPVRLMCYASIVFLIVSFGASDAAPFIYFQF
jgi:alginate O-acetyltransferase complex protein AlgI